MAKLLLVERVLAEPGHPIGVLGNDVGSGAVPGEDYGVAIVVGIHALRHDLPHEATAHRAAALSQVVDVRVGGA